MVTTFVLYDVGLVHLNLSPEAERAGWIAVQLQLPQHGLTARQYAYGVDDDIVSLLAMIRAEVRFIALLFSHQTPTLTGLAATTVLQGNADWVVPIRCEDCPPHEMLADMDHFNIFGVSESSDQAQLTGMTQGIRAVMQSMQDPW